MNCGAGEELATLVAQILILLSPFLVRWLRQSQQRRARSPQSHRRASPRRASVPVRDRASPRPLPGTGAGGMGAGEPPRGFRTGARGSSPGDVEGGRYAYVEPPMQVPPPGTQQGTHRRAAAPTTSSGAVPRDDDGLRPAAAPPPPKRAWGARERRPGLLAGEPLGRVVRDAAVLGVLLRPSMDRTRRRRAPTRPQLV